MILIADSGSTKTDWALLDGTNVLKKINTQGINPFHQDEDSIMRVLQDELLPVLHTVKIDKIFFYGSGCTPQKSDKVKRALQTVFSDVMNIEINGDLLAAARAVCGHQKGIACILGTGANSCCYDGEQIVMNTPPLGYILGDEGSGAVLGKLFLNGIFKGFLSEEIKEEYLNYSKLTYAEIINRVYAQPLANRFLASIAKFIAEHMDRQELRELVEENFRNFFRRNIIQYKSYLQIQEIRVGFVGGIAGSFVDILSKVAREEGYEMGEVISSPIDGLISYHGT